MLSVDATQTPAADDLREAIETQVCPWCGLGPFRLLTAHTKKAHGVSAHEFRVRAGLGYKEPTASEETRALNAAAAGRSRNVRPALAGPVNAERTRVLLELSRLAVASARSGASVDLGVVEALLGRVGPYIRAAVDPRADHQEEWKP